MRASRLLSILLQLQARGRISSRDLAKKLEVSERTVHRDMEALCASGVPVFAERGSRGGWELSEGYRTNLTGMKKEEVFSMILTSSTRIASDLGKKKDLDSAFMKFMASLPPAYQKEVEIVRQRIHIDGAGWSGSEEKFPFLPLLQEAVWKEKKIILRYGSDDKSKKRIVFPLGLVAKGRVWYLVAKYGKEFRTFRISRILEATLSGDSFERPKKFDLEKYWSESTRDFFSKLPSYRVRLRIKTDRFDFLNTISYVQILEYLRIDSDWSEIEADLGSREFALHHILGLGDSALLLEPKELREVLLSSAEKIINSYSKTSDP
ncbi:helix-turn-helix transcriptional regulator [Leptospira alstonii]|uniref:WYL domain protein n=2 Tax=Leptospira alstonii TaxID=28452 RepID=M6CQX4_9LEPT|nr:YafY family protein [Leptospira alstonii]EMJ94114.1 WYL domain protein [Leptospira alstonii serovar Sichuan str. 79601]EQA79281.1 WYL domain protein [Leptospira alstonii serovar Pingchang str. 80-412]